MARTILITGANRGIGLEFVRQYARDGWRVLASCRNPQGADKLRQIAKKSSGMVSIHHLDVTDTGQINDLARELIDERIDILLNNAGVHGPKQQDFGQVEEAGWIEAFRVNTIAPLKIAQAFLEHVANSQRKIIATMGSIMGSIGENDFSGYYAYRSTKAAVHMVMKNLSIDLKKKGIIAMAFHPGWVRTDMGGPDAPQSPEESVEGLRKVLASLTQEDNGRFLTYEGMELPW